MFLKVIFTWWNRQTFGTFLKTLFTGKLVGKDQFGNKYYKNKKDRWVIYSQARLKQAKLHLSGICGYIIR